jgi:hypothetical protein
MIKQWDIYKPATYYGDNEWQQIENAVIGLEVEDKKGNKIIVSREPRKVILKHWADKYRMNYHNNCLFGK